MAILRLEQELSCSLFDRKPHGLELTEDSEYLLPKALKIVKDIEECEIHFQKLRQESGPLRLCGTPGALNEYAGELLSGFQEENPQYRISIRECHDFMCDKAVETGEAEISFTAGPVDEQVFDCELMLKLQFFLLVHKSHPFAGKASIRLESLKATPLTVTCDGAKIHSELVKLCKAEGFTPEIQHLAVTPAFTHHAVAKGAAALVLRPEIYGVGRFDYLKAVPVVDSRIRWASYMIKKRGRSLSAEASELEQFFLSHKPIKKSSRGFY